MQNPCLLRHKPTTAISPLKIKQFFYGGDNLGYLLYAGIHALAIDAIASDEL